MKKILLLGLVLSAIFSSIMIYLSYKLYVFDTYKQLWILSLWVTAPTLFVLALYQYNNLKKLLKIGSYVVILLLCVSTVFASISESDVLAYSSFDSNFQDYTGVYNGTAQNGASISGVQVIGGNGSLHLDGTNDFVNYPATLHSADFTISVWLNPDDTILDGVWDKDGGGTAREHYFHYQSGKVQTIYLWDTADNIKTIATNTDNCNIPQNSWTHVVLAHDGTNTTLYINGTLCTTDTDTFTLKDASSTAFQLGVTDQGVSRSFDGNIDEFVFFNKKLTVTEVSDLYGVDGVVTELFTTPAIVSNYSIATAQDSDTQTQLKNWNATINENTHVATNTSIVFDGLYDSSGNNITLTNNSVTLKTGYRGTGFTFDGINDYVETNYDLNDTLDTLTFSTWVQVQNFSNQYQMIVGDTNSARLYFYYGNLIWRTTNDVPSNQDASYLFPTDGNWHHIVGTYNGSHMVLYVDGVEVSNQGGKSGTIRDRTEKVFMGSNDGTGWFYNGSIDEVILLNIALNSSQISDLYNNNIQFTANQLLYASFDAYNDTHQTLYNITAQAPLYFETTTQNVNVSQDFVLNLTQYPLVYVYNEYTNTSLNASITINNTTYYSGSSGVYVPFNSSQTVQINASNHFNKTIIHDFTGSTLLNVSLFQTYISFAGIEIITNNTVSPANFTIDGDTKTDSEHFTVNAGTYNVTFSAAGYYDKTIEITIPAIQNTTYNVTDVSGTIINVTANVINGTTINSFSINISNDNYSYSETYSTTSGWVSLSALQDVSFNVTIDAAGYALQNTTLTPNATLFNYTFELYTTNSINITFKDALTGSVLSGVNITADFIGSFDTYNYSTNTGYLYADLITPDDYVVRYEADEYAESFYYFTMSNRSTQEVTLYLTNSSETTDVTINVFDETNNDLEGALVKVLRLDVDGGTYVQVEARLTDFLGQTVVPLTLNSEFYKFIVEYPVGTIVKTTQPAYITGTTLNIQVQLTDSVATTFYNQDSISYLLTFSDSTNQFTYTYSDSQNLVSKGCLNVYRVSLSESTLVNSSCANSAASSISLWVDNSTTATFKAEADVYYGSERTYLTSLFKSFTNADLFGTTGLFLAVLMTIFIIFVARWSLTATVLMMPLPLVALRTVGIIQIGWDYIIGILGLALVLAYLLGRLGK